MLNDLKEDEDYLQEISPNLWLMDDHRWAFYVWEKARKLNQYPYSLVHLDYHFDGVNDFQATDNRDRLIAAATESEIFKFVKDQDHIQYDSFIAPAIIRGLIKEVHFCCKQTEDDTDLGIDSELLEEHGCEQYFYDNVNDLVADSLNEPILFDLCLDLFNSEDDKMYEGTLWEESEIVGTLEKCKQLLGKAAVTTISLSFGYSGTEEQTRYLAGIVIPKCIEHMKSGK